MSLHFSGTKVEDAKALIAQSSLKILTCDSLSEAAKMVSHCVVTVLQFICIL